MSDAARPKNCSVPRSRRSATPHGPQFPLLVKFLDARSRLVRASPSADALRSADHPGAHLKNECWHVLGRTEPDARILIGTKSGTDRGMFEASIDGRRLRETYSTAVMVQTGDTF